METKIAGVFSPDNLDRRWRSTCPSIAANQRPLRPPARSGNNPGGSDSKSAAEALALGRGLDAEEAQRDVRGGGLGGGDRPEEPVQAEEALDELILGAFGEPAAE